MSRLPQHEYPVDSKPTPTKNIIGRDVLYDGAPQVPVDPLTVLRQAVRDYFSARSPQAEDTLKRLVGLDANTAFEDAE